MDLPIELFPERRSRDRLRVLYADQDELSEDTLHFWRRMLLAYAKAKGKLHLSGKEIEEYFTLEGVIELVDHGMIRSYMYRHRSTVAIESHEQPHSHRSCLPSKF